MEGFFDLLANVLSFTQDNLISIFLIVLGGAIIIKITNNIIKTIVSIAILILFVKLLADMGLLSIPIPLLF